MVSTSQSPTRFLHRACLLCVRLVPESREIVLFSPRVGAYSAVNGPVRPQIVLKGPFSANGKCCFGRPIWRAPEGIPGVASRNLFGGPALAQLFPHILLDPRILIAQRTVAGLPTQDRTFLGLICSVPPLSLSIGQLPADRRGTAVQTASDFSTRNTIIFPQGYHSPLFSAKMVVAHRTASFGDKFLLTLLFYQIAAFLWAFFSSAVALPIVIRPRESPDAKRRGDAPAPFLMARSLPLARFGGCATLFRWWGYYGAQVRTLIWIRILRERGLEENAFRCGRCTTCEGFPLGKLSPKVTDEGATGLPNGAKKHSVGATGGSPSFLQGKVGYQIAPHPTRLRRPTFPPQGKALGMSLIWKPSFTKMLSNMFFPGKCVPNRF